MNDWLLFVISSFACYRLSHMLAGELGPANIFKKLRMHFSPKTNVGKGVRCPLCWSVWVAILITIYLWWLGALDGKLSPLYCLGVTGVAVLLHKTDD